MIAISLVHRVIVESGAAAAFASQSAQSPRTTCAQVFCDDSGQSARHTRPVRRQECFLCVSRALYRVVAQTCIWLVRGFVSIHCVRAARVRDFIYRIHSACSKMRTDLLDKNQIKLVDTHIYITYPKRAVYHRTARPVCYPHKKTKQPVCSALSLKEKHSIWVFVIYYIFILYSCGFELRPGL